MSVELQVVCCNPLVYPARVARRPQRTSLPVAAVHFAVSSVGAFAEASLMFCKGCAIASRRCRRIWCCIVSTVTNAPASKQGSTHSEARIKKKSEKRVVNRATFGGLYNSSLNAHRTRHRVGQCFGNDCDSVCPRNVSCELSARMSFEASDWRSL